MSSGPVGEETWDFSPCQFEDLVDVFYLHQVVDRQQSLEPGQQGRGVDSTLCFICRPESRTRTTRRCAAVGDLSRCRFQTVRQAMLATHSRRRNASPHLLLALLGIHSRGLDQLMIGLNRPSRGVPPADRSCVGIRVGDIRQKQPFCDHCAHLIDDPRDHQPQVQGGPGTSTCLL